MKKKILISSLITVIFAVIVITCSFIALINIREINRTEETLSIYTNLIIKSNDLSDTNFKGFKIDNKDIRFTIVNKAGDVLKDTTGESLENHANRKEIIEAVKSGCGSAVRYSKTQRKYVIYYAMKMNDNTIIRASIPLYTIKIFSMNYIEYYLILVIAVIMLSRILAMKLIRSILEPLHELEGLTNKIAKGDYSKRVRAYGNNEIGSLANTFNNMAEQLESKISDSLDKQNELEAILESMENGVIAVDNKQRVMLINSYAKRLFAIECDIIGENISEYILDYDITALAKNHDNIEMKEIKLIHPTIRELRIKKAPIINYENIPIGVVISVQDITDIKRLENMRSQFVANVSHELKTPLTSIKGFAETLRIVEDKTTKEKFLDIIDKETERLTSLINDILTLSNMENNTKMKEESFNPNKVIEEVVNMVTPQLNIKGIIVNCSLDGYDKLIGDKDKFYQMILNLVENSIKYSNNDANIKINTYSVNEYLYIEVKDNGIGIPVDDIPRIFERFYRVDKSRAKGGTGLGLAIVKHIAKMFYGEVFVQSKINKGTTFTIKIRTIR